jgi:ubiquitin-like-conjugating enzyme ATG3
MNERSVEDDWVLTESKEEAKVEDIDEESKQPEEAQVEEVGDIDDSDEDDNILAPKKKTQDEDSV